MKKLFLALVLACAAFSVHAAGFSFFDYADCVKDAKAVTDLGIGYGYGLDIHVAHEKFKKKLHQLKLEIKPSLFHSVVVPMFLFTMALTFLVMHVRLGTTHLESLS